MKNRKKLWLITSITALIPMVIGVLLWKQLPDMMVTHWGIDGTADGWSGKAFAVFGLPAILLAMHVLCLLATRLDRKNCEQNPKAMGIVYWIMPILSLLSCGSVYAVALGKTLDAMTLGPVCLGLLFMVAGNYMPKTKPNRTLGVKLPWTFANEENWIRTHRVCGKAWFAGGLLMMFAALMPSVWLVVVMSAALVILTVTPIGYSYWLYCRHKKQGIEYDFAPKTKKDRMVKNISVVLVTVILLGVAMLMFSGKIQYTCTDDVLQVKSTYWRDLTLNCDAIDDIAYRETCDFGVRTFGFGSAKLSLGQFQNEEFGVYTRYSYTACKAAVVIRAGDETLVLSAADAHETYALYEQLQSYIK